MDSEWTTVQLFCRNLVPELMLWVNNSSSGSFLTSVKSTITDCCSSYVLVPPAGGGSTGGWSAVFFFFLESMWVQSLISLVLGWGPGLGKASWFLDLHKGCSISHILTSKPRICLKLNASLNKPKLTQFGKMFSFGFNAPQFRNDVGSLNIQPVRHKWGHHRSFTARRKAEQVRMLTDEKLFLSDLNHAKRLRSQLCNGEKMKTLNCYTVRLTSLPNIFPQISSGADGALKCLGDGLSSRVVLFDLSELNTQGKRNTAGQMVSLPWSKSPPVRRTDAGRWGVGGGGGGVLCGEQHLSHVIRWRAFISTRWDRTHFDGGTLPPLSRCDGAIWLQAHAAAGQTVILHNKTVEDWKKDFSSRCVCLIFDTF